MRDIQQWWKEAGGESRPILVVGSGPTLARRGEFLVADYITVAVGDAAAEMVYDAVLIPDAETARAFVARENIRTVLVPRDLPVADFPTLKALDAQNRLVAYDSAGTKGAAEAVALAGKLGARTVRLLGVDPQMSGPNPTSADTAAADAIAAVIKQYQLDCGPLTSEVPARIFIGSDPSQALGAKILEYSVRKHSTLSVVFDTMQNVPVPLPKDPRNQPRTQFSFNRFAIPMLAGYRGRALYLDADMLVFQDLRELWELPFGDATAMYAPPSHPSRPKQTSVMLMDCSRLKWEVAAIVRDLDEGKYDYEGLMRDMKLEPEGAVQERLPVVWNSLEEYVPGTTRLIHYTDMKTQPWVSRRNPHGDLWVATLREALGDGFVKREEIVQAVQDGYIRPSLLGQLQIPQAQWPLFCRLAAPVLDVRYKPHRVLRKRLSGAGIGVS